VLTTKTVQIGNSPEGFILLIIKSLLVPTAGLEPARP
jgi:hypothetical protein